VCLDAALTLTHALAVAAVPLPRAGQLVVHLLGPRRELDAMHGAHAQNMPKHARGPQGPFRPHLFSQLSWRLQPSCRAA
jgi:hypothetical protein